MIAEAPGLSLTLRVRRLWEILDGLVPDQEEVGMALEKAVVFRQMEQGRIPEVVLTLVAALRRNPLWLPGYLLTAVIYRETDATEQAVETLKAGMRVCRTVSRLLAAQMGGSMFSGIENRIIERRLSARAARMRRYDDMLRRQLALILVEAEQFDEALAWLSEAGSG